MEKSQGILKPVRSSILNKQTFFTGNKHSSQGMEVQHEKPKFYVMKPVEDVPSGGMDIEEEPMDHENNENIHHEAMDFDGCSSEEFAKKRRERQLRENKRVRESFLRPLEDQMQ